MDRIENDFIVYWKQDGILFSAFKVPTVMTLDVIKTFIDLRHQISGGEDQYWCTDFHNLKEYKKEARDYAEVHGQEYLAATAVVIHSHVTRFILNTFMRLKKSEVPLQAFKTTEEAVAWLNHVKSEKH